MANLSEMVFLIQFIIFILITLWKTYNALNEFKEYSIKGSLLLFISSIFLFGVGLLVTMIEYSTMLISTLFYFQIFMLGLNLLFFIIELFFNLTKSLRPQKRYKQLQNEAR